MGPDERTTSDIEADAFFERWAHPTVEQFEAVWAEQYQNEGLERLAAEAKEYGYWRHNLAARAERRAQRELDATRRQQAQFDRLDRLRLDPGIPTTALTPFVELPAPRIVELTDEDRRETTYWWNRLLRGEGTRTLARRIRTEVRNAKDDDRFVARANAAWRDEQRAFERKQWRAVVAHRNARPAIKRAQAWVAIDEDRALQIALAALDKATRPQGLD